MKKLYTVLLLTVFVVPSIINARCYETPCTSDADCCSEQTCWITAGLKSGLCHSKCEDMICDVTCPCDGWICNAGLCEPDLPENATGQEDNFEQRDL